MDPCTTDWTEPENKAFKEVLVEVDLHASNWFEHLTKVFPNKTPGQLSVHYIDLVVDIGRKLRNLPHLIHTDPLAVKIAAEMEDLSSTDLPHPQGFQGTSSACSNGRVVNKEVLIPEIEKEVEMLLEKITKGETISPLETEGIEMVPGVVTEIKNENKIVTEVTVAAAGKSMVDRVGTHSTRKEKLWSEEEHRFDENFTI
ncbi:uncharacterized protein A4U43_C07F13530 [Asparagus officinalis]|uniref:Myb-like domain-containing protein n=1 Tax=Asparagus officinalis TaxID=4686 RepID=A0A5P1EEN7_ASPOF|nr:uncharacterized protein A4U43_C07F13530 [Asparagus officinalis]